MIAAIATLDMIKGGNETCYLARSFSMSSAS